MTIEEAKNILSFHSQRNPDIKHSKWENGFLGCINRAVISLNEENFHEVVTCIRVLMSTFEQEKIDSTTIADCWTIVYFTETSIRNKNLDDTTKKILEEWIEHISYIIFCLLDGCGAETAFEMYDMEFE